MPRPPQKLLAVAVTTYCLLPVPAVDAAPALEEVIVTAEKREESLQDVPISIAAFTNDALEKMGVHDIKGLASKVPNLVVNEFTGNSTTIRMFIRGVGQNDVQVTQDPSVALYMDGVYIGSSVGTAFETADIERVEVLRGPQGTLYGRNATGGAVNLVTARASTDEFYFRQRLVGGNLDTFRSRSILNLPVTDSVAVKLAYAYSERDDIVENDGPGENFGMEERDNITADMHWDATATVAVDYKYDRSTIQDTARLSQVLKFDPAAPLAATVAFTNPAVDSGGNPVEVTEDRLDKATAFEPVERGDVTIDAHTLNLGWELSDTLSLKSITGYRDVDSYAQMSQSPTTSLFGVYTLTNGKFDTDFEQYTQEFQLLGDTDTVSWVGGLFYYYDKSEEFNVGDALGSEPVQDQIVDFTSTQNTSLAAYGQATWTPENLDRWHFTLGMRYSDDNRKASRDNNRVSFGLGGSLTGIPAFQANYNQDFDEFNPSFTVEYDLNAVSNLYAKVVTAYKAGGTSQRSTNADNFETGFEPEDLTSYELGYKGDFLDSRLRFNSALFYMEYSDYQQSVQTGNNPGERDFVNIPDADITGLEFDITFAVTEQLVATFSYGYLDTNFGTDEITYLRTDASSPTGYSLFTEGLTDELALAPEHSATLSLDYNRPLPFGTLDANINAQYQEESLGGVQLPSGVLDDRTLVNATLGVSEMQLGSDAGLLRVSLWGNNLFDEEYYVGNIRQGIFDDLGFVGGLATFGDPRTYGVTLEYEY